MEGRNGDGADEETVMTGRKCVEGVKGVEGGAPRAGPSGKRAATASSYGYASQLWSKSSSGVGSGSAGSNSGV